MHHDQRLRKKISYGLDSDTAGFLPALMATHAVCHNGQSAFARKFLVGGGLPVSVLVFVIFSLAANVAETRQLNSGPYSHCTSCAAFQQVKTASRSGISV